MSGSTSSSPYGDIEETGDDIIDFFQLPVQFTHSYVEHTRRITDPRRLIRNDIHVERWSREKEIGRGGFGTVYLESERGGGERAVKQLSKKTGRARPMDCLREILAMAHCSKEEAYFVKFEGWYQDSNHVYLAMEYFPHGDLDACISTPLPEKEVQSISHQLIEALDFMHRKKFTHRDLKPNNVFVVTQGPEWWVKLGDFGVSKRVKDDSTKLHTSIDTNYTAPEISGHVDVEEGASYYTSAVDMWSLGYLDHWLLTKELPLSRQELLPYCAGRLQFPTKHLELHSCSTEALDFIYQLLRPQPLDRLTAPNALKHEWHRKFESGSTGASARKVSVFNPTNSPCPLSDTDSNIALWKYPLEDYDFLDDFSPEPTQLNFPSTDLEPPRGKSKPSFNFFGRGSSGSAEIVSEVDASVFGPPNQHTFGPPYQYPFGSDALSGPGLFGSGKVVSGTDTSLFGPPRLPPLRSDKPLTEPEKSRFGHIKPKSAEHLAPNQFTLPSMFWRPSSASAEHKNQVVPFDSSNNVFQIDARHGAFGNSGFSSFCSPPEDVTVHFSAYKGPMPRTISVMVFSARISWPLPVSDSRLPNPFAVISMSGQQDGITSTLQRVLNPSWLEKFEFQVDEDSLLVIQVFDAEERDNMVTEVLGIVKLRIGDLVDLTAANFNGKPILWSSVVL
ncbi:MAG: hypothetical protein L6R39_005558 [Caloplaca ligustica]|nr:MAG: hypothetical protein L6R39_005558 [Caloplaca ligustica]